MVNMKVAIYSRVSTIEQNPENQLNQLRSLALAQGGEVVEEYVDYTSGGRSDREGFLKMLCDADKREFDLLLIWSLDRLSREGISNTLGYLERLKRAGVSVQSLQESWLNTRDNGVGQLLIAIFSWVAKQERERIRERVVAGLKRAKKEGKKLGRPIGKKDSRKRSVSGYRLRYAGKKKEDRRLGKRKKEGIDG